MATASTVLLLLFLLVPSAVDTLVRVFIGTHLNVFIELFCEVMQNTNTQTVEGVLKALTCNIAHTSEFSVARERESDREDAFAAKVKYTNCLPIIKKEKERERGPLFT